MRVTAALASPSVVKLHGSHHPLAWFDSIKNFHRTKRVQVNWRRDLARLENVLVVRRPFTGAPPDGTKGCVMTSFPEKLTYPTVHRLLFHNCGYFDGKMPLDRRYSIPRWLNAPLLDSLTPVLFLLYRYRRVLRAFRRLSLSVSLARSFFSFLWIESRGYSSRHRE